MAFLIEGHRIQLRAVSTNIAGYLCIDKFKAPGVRLAEKMDFTSQCNINFKTFVAPRLKEVTDFEFDALWDPILYNIYGSTNFIGMNQVWSLTLPTQQGMSFYGYLSELEPTETGKDEVPKLNGKIVVSMYQPVGSSWAESTIGYSATGYTTGYMFGTNASTIVPSATYGF